MSMRRCLGILSAVATAFAAAMVPTAAAAQNAPDPHVLTCDVIVTPESQEEEVVSNMMVLWGIGYYYGRFSAYESAKLNAATYQESVSDFLNAVQSLCPTVPDMLYIDFLTNIGDDFATGLGIAE